MIDGIIIKAEIIDFPTWREKMPFEMFAPVNTAYGNIKSDIVDNSIDDKYSTITHIGQFQTYAIEVKAVQRVDTATKYYLKITGSLHKNKFNGKNYQRFFFLDVCTEIKTLCSVLDIDSRKAKIDNLEFGVNINVDFKPYNFLQQYLVNYKNLPFDRYAPDRHNRRLGYVCKLKHYWVKCYDKGLHFNLPDNLMRFELKYKIMQKLKDRHNIKYLYDLTQLDVVYNLKELLLHAWADVLLFENTQTNEEVLTSLQKELLLSGSHPKYWTNIEQQSKRKVQYHRSVMKKLFAKYGNGCHADITTKISEEWDLLFYNEL